MARRSLHNASVIELHDTHGKRAGASLKLLIVNSPMMEVTFDH